MDGEYKGGWCWIQDPRAIRFIRTYDRTYIGWAYVGKIIVGYYDHCIKKFGPSSCVYDTSQNNDHIAPSIMILPDGYIHVFWSMHGTGPVYMRKSARAEDISEWKDIQIVSGPDNNCCYTNPVYLANGRIYLFYRDCNNWNVKWTYSYDGGLTWSQPQVVLDFHNGKYNEAYVKVEPRGNAIHLALSACRHWYWATYQHIFYAYFDGLSWKKHDGARLDLPLTPRTIEMTFDSDAETSWIWDIAVDTTSNPIIVFSHNIITENHEYWSVRWDGKQWTSHKICYSRHGGLYQKELGYSGGLCLNHSDPTCVYVSVWEKNSFEIKKFKFVGNHWQKIDDITRNSNSWNIRPVSPRNATKELEVIWMQGKYKSFTNYDTVIKGWPYGHPLATQENRTLSLNSNN